MVPNEVPLIDIARTLPYPAPFFYTSRDVLTNNYTLFNDLFENSEIFYALKANSDPKILRHLDQLGCGFEAASAYEIDMLLDIGVDPYKIIYGTSIKPSKQIQSAIEVGVNRFAVDSKEEIDKVAYHAPGARVYVRAVVDDTGSVFTMSERFGTPVDQLKDLLLYAKHRDLKVYGISFYVGSQATHANRWAKGIDAVRPTIEALYEQGMTIEALNIGGGFPVNYRNHKDVPHLQEIVAQINNALHRLPYIPKLILEPGRGIVASSTVLVTEIISKTTRHGQVWLCVDAGIYNALYEAMIHQGSTQYTPYPVLTPELSSEMMTCTITGPTGDSLDVISRDVELPSYLDVGDRIIFDNAGAYTISMANTFNGMPVPELYLG